MIKNIAKVFLCCVLVGGALQAAPKKPKKPSANAVKNLQSGSVINGVKATGSLQRWMFFNDGFVGSSWTKIGRSEYISVDFGYSATIATIGTAGGLRGIFGVDFAFPIYVAARGQTNGLTTHNSFAEVLGWGAIVPLSIGLDVNGFYIRGLVGYAYNDIVEGFDLPNKSDATTMQMRYHGVVYGAGMGYRISNILNIGFKALFGEMKNDVRATNDATLIQVREFKNKKYDLMQFGGYVSIIF
ncbi:hypothetical protein BBW65_07315 [Helicobacter enhydrae]|uniref:Outer membrane beta-barrel protein n=1 Tax=Helicobacter enhydrae TaxID=222136 RepID=A0A1B1U7A3_9HELI|nr:hypothetical protein [Helicobacter enhydrae]ANV98616.1 hypothetical protein BBW65_07315 [Helicobacter enhydrae]